MFNKICEFCKNEFTHEKRKVRFCSPKCGHESKRKIYTPGENPRSKAVAKRRRALKVLAIEYKGGKCQICGYCKCAAALHFHHLDPNEKDFGISVSGATRGWETLKIELDKCALLCANCHAEVHASVVKIE